MALSNGKSSRANAMYNVMRDSYLYSILYPEMLETNASRGRLNPMLVVESSTTVEQEPNESTESSL